MKLFSKKPTLRSLAYVSLSFGSIAWLFAPYWNRFSAILTTIVIGVIFAILSLVIQRIPSSNYTRKAIKRNEALCYGSLTFMTIISAIIVPIVWYFESFGASNSTSYIEDCKFLMPFCLLFSIVALEAQILLNKSAYNTVPLYRIPIISLICVFGFTGLKQLCKLTANFSGDNFFCSMLLIALVTVAPLLIIMIIFAYYISEARY